MLTSDIAFTVAYPINGDTHIQVKADYALRIAEFAVGTSLARIILTAHRTFKYHRSVTEDQNGTLQLFLSDDDAAAFFAYAKRAY